MARSERVVAAVLVLALAAACNAITGLDDFHDVACEPCEEAGSPDSSPIAPDDAAVDAPQDATVDVVEEPSVDAGTDASEGGGFQSAEAGTAVDHRWPRWLMPNRASDAALPSYTALSGTDGGVLDDVTHLEWGNATTGVTSIASATTVCGPPWRLPTRIELVSILDTSQTSDAAWQVLVNPVFSSMQAARYWTSSVTPTGQPWTVDFAGGAVQPGVQAQAAVCIYVGDAGTP